MSKRCNLCLTEKYNIICKPSLCTLNKRTEILSTCRHNYIITCCATLNPTAFLLLIHPLLLNLVLLYLLSYSSISWNFIITLMSGLFLVLRNDVVGDFKKHFIQLNFSYDYYIRCLFQICIVLTMVAAFAVSGDSRSITRLARCMIVAALFTSCCSSLLLQLKLGALVIVFCVIQFLALAWYSISYIPFAR